MFRKEREQFPLRYHRTVNYLLRMFLSYLYLYREREREQQVHVSEREAERTRLISGRSREPPQPQRHKFPDSELSLLNPPPFRPLPTPDFFRRVVTSSRPKLIAVPDLRRQRASKEPQHNATRTRMSRAAFTFQMRAGPGTELAIRISVPAGECLYTPRFGVFVLRRVRSSPRPHYARLPKASQGVVAWLTCGGSTGRLY